MRVSRNIRILLLHAKIKIVRKSQSNTKQTVYLLNLTKKLDPAGFSHGSNLDIQGDRWQVQGSGPSSHTGNQHGLFPWMDTQFPMYSPLSNVHAEKVHLNSFCLCSKFIVALFCQIQCIISKDTLFPIFKKDTLFPMFKKDTLFPMLRKNQLFPMFRKDILFPMFRKDILFLCSENIHCFSCSEKIHGFPCSEKICCFLCSEKMHCFSCSEKIHGFPCSEKIRCFLCSEKMHCFSCSEKIHCFIKDTLYLLYSVTSKILFIQTNYIL